VSGNILATDRRPFSMGGYGPMDLVSHGDSDVMI
jgi:hypothetical protein